MHIKCYPLTEINQNFQGVYSATSVLTESNLHSRVLRTRLTPKLGYLVPMICDELDYAMTQELPDINGVFSNNFEDMINMLIFRSEEWNDVEAFSLIIRLVSRVSSRLFIGDEICRNMTWLKASRGKHDLTLGFFHC